MSGLRHSSSPGLQLARRALEMSIEVNEYASILNEFPADIVGLLAADLRETALRLASHVPAIITFEQGHPQAQIGSGS